MGYGVRGLHIARRGVSRVNDILEYYGWAGQGGCRGRGQGVACTSSACPHTCVEGRTEYDRSIEKAVGLELLLSRIMRPYETNTAL